MKRRPIIIRPEAQKEIEEVHDWYEGKRIGLGEEFEAVLHQKLRLIQRLPGIGYEVMPGVRRIKLGPRFPYLVLYRPTKRAIFVEVVYHQRRSPDYWKKRIQDD